MNRRTMFAASLALVACGSDSLSPAQQLTGTYALRTLNGAPGPWSSGTPADRVVIAAWTITFAPEARYQSVVEYHTSTGATTQTTLTNETGTYAVAGQAVTLASTAARTQALTWSGKTLTMDAAGRVYVFQR